MLKIPILLLLTAMAVQAGSLSIAEYQKHEGDKKALTLAVKVAAAPGTAVDINRVRIRACIFEKGRRGEVGLAQPNLGFLWTTLPANWTPFFPASRWKNASPSPPI